MKLFSRCGLYRVAAFVAFLAMIWVALSVMRINRSFPDTSSLLPEGYTDQLGVGAVMHWEPSVAEVLHAGADLSHGRAVFLRPDGYLLTNKHVVSSLSGAYQIRTFHGDVYDVDFIWHDPDYDLAIISLVTREPLFNPIPFIRKSDSPTIGEMLVNIHQETGLLMADDAHFNLGGKRYTGLYEADMTVNRGDSGGPLLDERGYVVGVITASAEHRDVAFAIPVDQVFVDEILGSVLERSGILRDRLE